MATMAAAARKPVRSIAPDLFERILAVASIVLIAMVIAALAKGFGEWVRIPAIVWAHLATIAVALALTPVMLLRRRGDRLHRRLGWLWCLALFGTALISFGIRSAEGQFSWIHLLSVFTLIQVPLIVISARRHNIRGHRSAVRGMTTGALLVAGFFTFPFDRLLGHWLFS